MEEMKSAREMYLQDDQEYEIRKFKNSTSSTNLT